jgi:hypothetical protein
MPGLGLSLPERRTWQQPAGLPAFATAPAAAFSVRKLRAAYAGACMRLRRASDDAEVDIGFDGAGWLDEAATRAHLGAASGFVVTWYDQSGNARHATQAAAAAQPRLANAGAIDRLNARPVLVFDGTDDTLAVASWGAIAQPFTRLMVVTQPVMQVSHLVNSEGGSPNTADVTADVASMSMYAGAGANNRTVAAGDRLVRSSVFNGASSISVHNGVSVGPTDAGADGYAGITLGSFNGAAFFARMNMAELIIINAAMDAPDRAAIEKNAGLAFGIPVI